MKLFKYVILTYKTNKIPGSAWKRRYFIDYLKEVKLKMQGSEERIHKGKCNNILITHHHKLRILLFNKPITSTHIHTSNISDKYLSLAFHCISI